MEKFDRESDIVRCRNIRDVISDIITRIKLNNRDRIDYYYKNYPDESSDGDASDEPNTIRHPKPWLCEP